MKSLLIAVTCAVLVTGRAPAQVVPANIGTANGVSLSLSASLQAPYVTFGTATGSMLTLSGGLVATNQTCGGSQCLWAPSSAEGGAARLYNANSSAWGTSKNQTVHDVSARVDASPSRYYNALTRWGAYNPAASPQFRAVYEMGVEGNYLDSGTDAVQRLYLWDLISGRTVFFMDRVNPGYFFFQDTTRVAFLGPADFGSSGTFAGSFNLYGATSGHVTVNTPAVVSTYTLTLPANAGAAGQVLVSDGAGGTSWRNLSGCAP